MVQDPISLQPEPDEASQTFRARILNAQSCVSLESD